LDDKKTYEEKAIVIIRFIQTELSTNVTDEWDFGTGIPLSIRSLMCNRDCLAERSFRTLWKMSFCQKPALRFRNAQLLLRRIAGFRSATGHFLFLPGGRRSPQNRHHTCHLISPGTENSGNRHLVRTWGFHAPLSAIARWWWLRSVQRRHEPRFSPGRNPTFRASGRLPWRLFAYRV